MPSNKTTKQSMRGSRHALNALDHAAKQYAEYVRIASVGALTDRDETWNHDPSTPLSLELLPRQRCKFTDIEVAAAAARCTIRDLVVQAGPATKDLPLPLATS